MPISKMPTNENLIRRDSFGLVMERGNRAPALLVVQYETNQHASRVHAQVTGADGKRINVKGIRVGADNIRVLVFFGENMVYTSTYADMKATERCGVLAGLLEDYTIVPRREVA